MQIIYTYFFKKYIYIHYNLLLAHYSFKYQEKNSTKLQGGPGMYKNRVNNNRNFFPILRFLLNFLVCKIKEWEFQKKFCLSLPYFYTYIHLACGDLQLFFFTNCIILAVQKQRTNQNVYVSCNRYLITIDLQYI